MENRKRQTVKTFTWMKTGPNKLLLSCKNDSPKRKDIFFQDFLRKRRGVYFLEITLFVFFSNKLSAWVVL